MILQKSVFENPEMGFELSHIIEDFRGFLCMRIMKD